ncbi:ABC transporter permease [Chelatococcus asaccharovorans]|uniref:Peptide/nickel transport system permease protein n=1 Tax=Chelatococcus asaccharovorans TaxID=28210 RepID=A0A2V3TY54_9HYPH|nr:ABC transporter permease [Chelatococcus asaccharovorans]MBS7706863.1 ABC transporter permease [Chelatococcus asaccharovorans]PXW53991.1 peptide/nickel transport system permease protein [Chelatococcus asaccharovorans]
MIAALRKVRTFAGGHSGWIGLVLLAAVILIVVLAPLFGLPDPVRNNLRGRFVPPSFNFLDLTRYPLGGDHLGRDLFSRIVYGGRVSLAIGALAVGLGGVIGVIVGLFAGFYKGWVDRVLMRLVDVQLSIPLMLLALLVVAALGPSLQNLIIVLALTSWVRYARVVRGQVLAVREREFVQSAYAIGVGNLRIIFVHILPNVLTPVLVIATLELARVIILEAGMSFLGLGVQPPWPSWGRMLAEGRNYMGTYPEVSVYPGLALFITALAVNLSGDWLRDRLDPKLR